MCTEEFMVNVLVAAAAGEHSGTMSCISDGRRLRWIKPASRWKMTKGLNGVSVDPEVNNSKN